jgi:aryl-alcohol dehydrogenase-like predicted oxidoreductase
MKACEDSLRRLDTDYIDLYQMHRYDETTPVEETLSTLNDLVRQGKVRYIGVSNWTASQIVEACSIIAANGWEPLVSMQPQYSILSRDIEVEILPACRKFGLGVIPWSPLAGGMLTGKYRAGEEPQQGTRFAAPGPFQRIWRTRALNERNHAIVSLVLEEAAKLEVSPIALALAWNLARPGIVSPIIGPKSERQLKDNLAALDVVLPNETVERIDAASEPYLPYPHDFMRMARQLTAMMVQQNSSAKS